MRITKFKVGDKVITRPNLLMRDYGIVFYRVITLVTLTHYRYSAYWFNFLESSEKDIYPVIGEITIADFENNNIYLSKLAKKYLMVVKK